MNGVLPDVDVSISTKEADHQFVVISRNVNYASALAGFAQDFLDDIVMLLGPINSAAQRPDIDQIAHDIKRFEIVFAQKIEEAGCPTGASTQMDIGNPGGPDPD